MEFNQDNIKIINADCMDIMANYADKYFDLAIVDPPYGIGIGKKKTIGKRGKTYTVTNYHQSEWDNKIPDKQYFDELFRVSQNQIIFGANYFSHFLPPSAGWFVYNKQQPENFSMAHAELAFTSFDRAVRMKGIPRNEVGNCISNNKEKGLIMAKIHQCQKPIRLYEYLLKTYAKKGFKIIDTHLGSGSSAIAADNFNIAEFLGIEKDEIHFKNSIKRYKIETLQKKLF